MKPLIPLLGSVFLVGAGFFGSYFHSNFQSKAEIIEESERQPEEIKELKLTSSWKGPRFLSTHHFKRLEFSFPSGLETTFKESVDGLDPKIKGGYYVEWVDGDWENHVKNLNSRNENDNEAFKAIFGDEVISSEKLKDTCNSYASKKLKIAGNEKSYTFKGEGDSSIFEEWKNAVLVCTRTFRLEDYFQRAYPELIKGKEVITDAVDISSEALKLRDEDASTNKNTSMTYGKEYLQDRLRGLDDDEVRHQILEWCKYLGNKAASLGTWNNDKDNFKDYCMKSKNAPKRSLTINPPKAKGEMGVGTVGYHFEKEYLGENGALKHKRIVTSAKEVSNSVWSLRQEDERNYESSISLGKEFLYDRLKEKSLELVKEEVFEWCNFLKTRPDSTKERNLENLRTYCLVDKSKVIN